MSIEDKDVFEAELDGVEPIPASDKVLLKRPRSDSPGLIERRRAAQESSEISKSTLSAENIGQVDPHAVLSFQRPGIQHGVFRKLRLGHYQLEARLDLHRLTVDQARQSLLRFLKDCVAYDVRCGLITHGKGEGRAEPARLKSCIAAWLPQRDEVLAFHSAQKHHGGVGATYVLIRKSEKKKRDTWERHIGRRG